MLLATTYPPRENGSRVNLDTTSKNRIVGIEILHASKKMSIKTILSYELELDNKLLQKTA